MPAPCTGRPGRRRPQWPSAACRAGMPGQMRPAPSAKGWPPSAGRPGDGWREGKVPAVSWCLAVTKGGVSAWEEGPVRGRGRRLRRLYTRSCCLALLIQCNPGRRCWRPTDGDAIIFVSVAKESAMSLLDHQLELLSPAKTAEIGREAILHGADAVYIGGPAFGARHNASNSIEEISSLVEFAHRYRSRIFVTLNTILHDAELDAARKQIWQLYEAGVDALIVQDMGLLEMDLPPIQLHASTQCDIRTMEKAKFLGDVGFSQLVLARELTIEQIKKIRAEVDTPLEYFIHGALCVAYSGQCYISHADTGRSANRGDCSQACRLPYTLSDGQGRVVAFDKHLLSMKDNDQSRNLEALVDAGIRSFKIEGRYKDMGYVKNITAHYRLLLDELLERRPEFTRAASGRTRVMFTPDVDKNFHRGHTEYFAQGRLTDIGAFDSPKYVGVELGIVARLNGDSFDVVTSAPMANGDGLNYMHKRDTCGIQANRADKLGDEPDGQRWRVYPNEPMQALTGLKVG